MHPISFEGSVEIKKPRNMTDEECYSIWARKGLGKLIEIIDLSDAGIVIPPIVAGVDTNGFPYFMTAWQPNKEDIEAINRGEPVYVKTLSKQLPPMALFTIDENKQGNF